MTKMQSVSAYIRRAPLDKHAGAKAEMSARLLSDDEIIQRWLAAHLERALKADRLRAFGWRR